MIQRRTRPDAAGSFKVKTDKVGGGEAMSMFRQSRHLQVLALIIGFGALWPPRYSPVVDRTIPLGNRMLVFSEIVLVGSCGPKM